MMARPVADQLSSAKSDLARISIEMRSRSPIYRSAWRYESIVGDIEKSVNLPKVERARFVV